MARVTGHVAVVEYYYTGDMNTNQVRVCVVCVHVQCLLDDDVGSLSWGVLS